MIKSVVLFSVACKANFNSHNVLFKVNNEFNFLIFSRKGLQKYAFFCKNKISDRKLRLFFSSRDLDGKETEDDGHRRSHQHCGLADRYHFRVGECQVVDEQ